MRTSTSAYLASLSATLTVALMAATVTPATAHAETVRQSQEVRFNDLDLASSQGKHQLERRIQRAARTVCGMDEIATGTRLASREASRCYNQALRDTREQTAAAIANGRQGA